MRTAREEAHARLTSPELLGVLCQFGWNLGGKIQDHAPECDRLTAAFEARDAEHEAIASDLAERAAMAFNAQEAELGTDIASLRRDLATARSALESWECPEVHCIGGRWPLAGNGKCTTCGGTGLHPTALAALTPATGEPT